MLEIDGSLRSGSGTIARDAVPFAILRGKALRLSRIRAKRSQPGLRPQHLKALEACARLCDGRLEGGWVGASEITFHPGEAIRGGEFSWDIGTAGSATMLAMTLLPLALFAAEPSVHTITGGLFQDFAPSAFHFREVLLPALQAMGADARLEILRPGYVPMGQGRIRLQVAPARGGLRPLERCAAGRVEQAHGIALASRLADRRVAERMARECRQKLARGGYTAGVVVLDDTPEKPVYRQAAVQPGAALAVWACTSTGCRIGADMAGAVGRSSERIGAETARRLLEDLGRGATVDRYLADQLIPFAALARGESRFRIPRMTDHVESRLWLVEEILGAKTELDGTLVRIRGIGYGGGSDAEKPRRSAARDTGAFSRRLAAKAPRVAEKLRRQVESQ